MVSKYTKKYQKLISQAEKNIHTEVKRQIDILYHAAGLVLHDYGWNREQIEDFACVSNDIYGECADNATSLIQMLYDETSIELKRSDGSQSFKDVLYLGDKDQTKPLSAPEYLIMKQNQLKWVPAQITASIILALKRIRDWDDEQCGMFFEDLEDMKWRYDSDPQLLIHTSKQLTGFYLTEEAYYIKEKEK